MISEVLMPQLGLEVIEATVIDVTVAVGDQVQADAVLIELETDKALTAVVAPRAGFVVALHAARGDVVAVGTRLAVIADSADEAPHDDPDTSGDGRGAEAAVAPAAVDAATGRARICTDRVRAAPVARRAAGRLGIALTDLSGSGPRGRITLRDVEAAAAGTSGPVPATGATSGRSERASAQPATVAGDVEPISRLRQTIAKRMSASQLIPQYQLQRDVDASHLLAQKDAQAAAGGPSRPGLNELLTQAVAEMVVRHPALAMTYVDGPSVGLRRHEDIGVGLAVATERGLLVPVLRGVHRIGLHALAEQRQALVAAARSGRLGLDEMTGAAITLSNLGSFGVDRFTAMLNPGESTIVAVGRITDQVVPRERGLAIVPVLTLTLSFDHRSIDGAVGGAALTELAELLEGAMAWRP